MVLHTLLGVNFASIAKENRREVKERERERERKGDEEEKKKGLIFGLSVATNSWQQQRIVADCTHTTAKAQSCSSWSDQIINLLDVVVVVVVVDVVDVVFHHCCSSSPSSSSSSSSGPPTNNSTGTRFNQSFFFFFSFVSECVCVCVCVCLWVFLPQTWCTIEYYNVQINQSHNPHRQRETHTETDVLWERERERDTEGDKKKRAIIWKKLATIFNKKGLNFLFTISSWIQKHSVSIAYFLFFPSPVFFLKISCSRSHFCCCCCYCSWILGLQLLLQCLVFFFFITMKKWDPDLSFLFFPVDEWSNLRK